LEDKVKALNLRLRKLLPALNEKQRRMLAAAEAKSFGRGGIQQVSELSGMSRQTIYRGIEDLNSKRQSTRIRSPGGGRKKIGDEKLIRNLDKIIEPVTRGHPESSLRWTCKSVRNLSDDLLKRGHKVSYRTIARMLGSMGYSLQANRKTSEGKKDHPDRNEQFLYINKTAERFLRRNQPVISVDTKKKELVGRYKNPGEEWRGKRNPIQVLSHDFPDPKVPKAVPYGVYDIGKNAGWVNVGISSDTAEFAVESIRQWWRKMGKRKYGEIKNLLITADSGGSNGYRLHLWKRELQKFSNQERMNITVCHFPPGTSKWNKIEHRLFSYITKNWRGRPLLDYETVVNLIAATTTKSGLTVKVRFDKRIYDKGIKVTTEEIKNLNIKKHKFHGEWNYTIKPQNKNV
jgi:transposase